MSLDCIFCKIVTGEIPVKKLYEDEHFLAFPDIRPAAPIHALIIPRQHIISLQDVHVEDATWLGKMMILVPKLAHDLGCREASQGGFRLVTNAGADAGQEVPHLHFHILGGPRPWHKRTGLNA